MINQSRAACRAKYRRNFKCGLYCCDCMMNYWLNTLMLYYREVPWVIWKNRLFVTKIYDKNTQAICTSYIKYDALMESEIFI